MDFQRQTAILATTVEDTLNLSKSITEYGIMITISAVFLILTLFIFKRMINSYTKTIDGINELGIYVQQPKMNRKNCLS